MGSEGRREEKREKEKKKYCIMPTGAGIEEKERGKGESERHT